MTGHDARPLKYTRPIGLKENNGIYGTLKATHSYTHNFSVNSGYDLLKEGGSQEAVSQEKGPLHQPSVT